MDKLTYSVSEVSVILGLSESKTYSLVRNNVIPNIKLGGRFVVPKDAFAVWFASAVKGGEIA